MSEPIPTPELNKMAEIREESQAIGEFLEWAGSKGMVLGEDVQYDDRRLSQFVPVSRGIEELLAEFFEIDLVKVEQERRKVLDALRSL